MINKNYDRIVFVTRILISAITALYLACAKIWGFPYAEEVALTSSALVAFLNTLMKIKSDAYFDDHDIVEKGDENEDSN